MRFLQPALIAAALLCAPIILLRALGFFVGWTAIIYIMLIRLPHTNAETY